MKQVYINEVVKNGVSREIEVLDHGECVTISEVVHEVGCPNEGIGVSVLEIKNDELQGVIKALSGILEVGR